MFFIFAWFREYACIYVCPYGRLQSVLLDKDSVVIAYDFVRGEPRGKLHKNEERNLGDCIDCGLCTAVCPTGIDIRNGTQLECVNCAACIDACDSVMDKINKPRGLIRYSSFNQIQNRTKFKFTAREKAYTVIFVILSGVLTYLLVNRMPVDITLLRAPGMTYQEQPDNKISNLYTMKVVNKTFEEVSLELKVKNPGGEIKIIGDKISVPPNEVTESKFLIFFSKDLLPKLNEPVEIIFLKNGEEYYFSNITFLAPR
ncbi:MAG: 4Fe-4S dicluster domain-containing protein [Ignavibacteria bacterium]|nr:4Fe-4S dicluster domain-containing protein [Ignavibacteria bacterium]